MNNNILYVLLNATCPELKTELLEKDFSEAVMGNYTSAVALKTEAESYENPNELSVMSLNDNFITVYGYNTWKKKFARD